ncbi:MAG: FKBP-type peptidyl-prolyl cis-trans isomerase [Kangiellaceae bacterium]|jgi:FKBP-type peptidyl-prolyl cis-trans isomerase SlpA|nr:FKBP-type peptidyl-prolyl cis-trans isomerase [Kangiellaceae bacterium]
MSVAVVSDNSHVFLHMNILLEDDSAVDSTRVDGKPQVIVIGNNSVSEVMEQQLIGLKVGDKKKFTLAADDAFGQVNPELIQFMDIQSFPEDLDVSLGSVISFEQPNGQPLPGIIREVQGHSVKVDFNHPLAGQPVIFDVEIVSIDTAPAAAKKA